MLSFSRGLVGLAQDVQELVRHRFVDDLVEHLTQLHADGLLTQSGFIERRGAFTLIFHGYVFDHVLDTEITHRRPPPLAECVSARRQRRFPYPVPKAWA
jgi:hypothetical protein